MLKFYVAEKDSLQAITQEAVGANLARLAWVDLLNPTDEEESYLEKQLKIDIPTRAEMHEIELSNRLYQENGALYATATILTGADTPAPETHAITFVLIANCLVTVRYSDPQFIRIFRERMQKYGFASCQGGAVLAGLLEAIVNRVADTLEAAGHHINSMARTVFRPDPQIIAAKNKPDFAEILRQIGIKGDLISKTRESMVSISRLISFVNYASHLPAGSPEHSKMESVRHDIAALTDHAGFLANKMSFLLDATLGMISIEQNAIIKIFSVAAVVFLPPTLVASIYGMNFNAMPELHWAFGYPMAIIFMILSAYLPYTFFRKKGWL